MVIVSDSSSLEWLKLQVPRYCSYSPYYCTTLTVSALTCKYVRFTVKLFGFATEHLMQKLAAGGRPYTSEVMSVDDRTKFVQRRTIVDYNNLIS